MSWDIYWDWKYPATVVLCLGVGFLAGYWECKIQQRVKEREEAHRLATKNTIVD